MSLRSPQPRSSHPLGPSTRRVGSSAFTIFRTSLVMCWPQPSLNGTHTITLGALPRPWMTDFSSRSQLVAPVIPARGFHLHVFARHVETEFLERVDIAAQGFVGGCGVEAVRPPSLIEGTDEKQRLVVEENAVGPSGIGARFHAAHAQITPHRVAGL